MKPDNPCLDVSRGYRKIRDPLDASFCDLPSNNWMAAPSGYVSAERDGYFFANFPLPGLFSF